MEVILLRFCSPGGSPDREQSQREARTGAGDAASLQIIIQELNRLFSDRQID